MLKKYKTSVLVAVVACLIGALSACGVSKAAEPFHDAKRSGVTNSDSADVIEFPDGFSNWSTKCDHGNRIYSAFHGDNSYAGGFVAPKDPTCS